MGAGVYTADRSGAISTVVNPGDPAPGGGRFDFAGWPSIDDGGDVAFVGHRAGEVCDNLDQLQADVINCFDTVYVRRAATALIERIAGPGDPAPGGDVLGFATGPRINNRGEVVFHGPVPPALRGVTNGVFLASPSGKLIDIVRPGDSLPGGGHARFLSLAYALNDVGQVAFWVQLQEDLNGDGRRDTGIYLWQDGAISLIARSGMLVPGVGEIRGGFTAVQLNNRGEVMFWATLTSGTGVLLVAETH